MGLQDIQFEKAPVCFSVSSAGIDLLQAILNQHMKSAGRSYLLIINRLVNQNIAPKLRKDLISSQEPYMDKTWKYCSRRREKALKELLKVTKMKAPGSCLWCNLK